MADGRTHFEILEEQAKLIYQEELAERERIESSEEEGIDETSSTSNINKSNTLYRHIASLSFSEIGASHKYSLCKPSSIKLSIYKNVCLDILNSALKR